MKRLLQITTVLILFSFISSGLFAQLPNIMSLQITPLNPTTMDTVKVISDIYFSSGDCSLTTSSVNFAPGMIDVNAFHMLGPLTYICGSTDTITLGILTAGDYKLLYHLSCGPYPGCYDLDSVSFTVQLYSGIEWSGAVGEKLAVFPVPSSGLLNITLPDITKQTVIRIFDPSGQNHIKFEPNSSIKQYDISRLTGGVYLIEADCGDRIYRSKIVKQ